MRRFAFLAPLFTALMYGQGGYTGPSVLSRPGGPANHRPTTLAFRPYASVSGIYDTGLTAFSVNESGELPDDDAAGVEVRIGAYAYRNWQRTVAALQYSGDYRHYDRDTYYDGSNHFATFGVTRQQTSRLQLGVRQMAGTFSRAFGVFGGQFTTLAPSLMQTPLQMPADELFDNRTYHFSTMGDMVYQKTARLSFALGGGGFLVRRQSAALLGVSGGMAQGDVSYRVSRRATVGVSYAFVHYGFTNTFGNADVHMVGVNYANRISRHWELGLMLSGIRVESRTIRQVAVDPVVAAITGITVGSEAYYANTYMTGIGARLNRAFRRANLTFSYIQGVSPGNGLLLTSRQRTATATYSYTGFRRWSLYAGAAYGDLGSVTNQIASYRRFQVNAGLSRSLWGPDFHFVANVAARRYETDFSSFPSRTQTRFTVGISYSPGDVPLALW
jgi:hypothetical protein